MTFEPITNFAETEPPARPPPAAPARRRSRWPVILAWMVILGSVAMLIVRPRWAERGGGDGAESAARLPSVGETTSPQLQLISRYVVGVKAFAGDRAPPADVLLKQIDVAATNPIDEFRAIAVVGELSGAKAALQRLDEFERKHKVVRLRQDVDDLRTIYTKGADELGADRAARLVERHHWFGQLAISQGLSETDPRRAAALQPARRSIWIMGLGFFLGLGAVVTGLVLLILTLVLWLQRRIVPAYRPPTAWIAGPLVEAFALYLVGMIVLSYLLARLFPDGGLSLTFFLFALLPLAMGYLRLRGVGWGEMMRGLGLVRGRGFWREVGVGLYGYLAGLPVLVVGVLITFFLMKLTGNTPTPHPIQNAPMDRPVAVLQLVLLACVGAPIVEEAMFRGALLGHLRIRLAWWISAPIVSLIFAAIHPQGWVAIPVLGAIAMVLAGLREWRGSLIASMTAHAVNNGVAVLVLVLLMG